MSLTRRDVMRFGLSAAAFGGCCTSDTTNRDWNNAINTDGVDPKQISSPRSLQELVDAVQKAEGSGQRVRMVGSGHSFSDVAFTTDHLMKPDELDSTLVVPWEQLRPPRNEVASGLVRVQSGRTIRQLNPYLEGKGRAFENLGGFDAQTIVGAAMTGTHGSGLGYGPIASQIESLQIVTKGGEVLQVEPSQGITDDDKFPDEIVTQKEPTVKARLVQNDELFNAIAVSMGTMGIVYSVVLRTEPKFWLREVRERMTWKKLRTEFLDPLVFDGKAPGSPAPDYYEVYFNPYEVKGEHTCLLTSRYKIGDPGNLSPAARKRGKLGLAPIAAMSTLTNRGAALADYLDAHPEKVPQTIEDALAVLSDKEFIDVSHRVFHLGPANYLRVLGIEMGFPIADTKAVVEELFVIAAELRDRGWLHSSPPSLRFVKKSDAHLAMMHGRDTMMLEMGMLVSARGDRGLLEEYERRFIRKFAGRPHWGLDLNILRSFEDVKKLYPISADRWRAQFEAQNANGTFDGPFTDRLGISMKART